ncbi:MAG TPA: sugar ABC transporter permease [Anaerolineae bacterium]
MKSRLSKRWSLSGYQAQIQLLLLPYLVGSLILVIVPALATVAVSLTAYNAVAPPQWVALDNFRRLVESPYVRTSLRNSLIFIMLAVPLRIMGAFVLALLLQPNRRLFGLFRASVYLPTVIPQVAYALIWLWVFNPLYGPLNIVLGWLGLPTPAWLVEPATARLAIVIVLAFQLGEGFIVLLAGLRTIPRFLYEAALVDGANDWHCFWRITWPLMTPWLLLLTFRDLIVSLQSTFTPSFVITYGGPYYATTFVPLLVYELAFDFFDFGLAAALLVLTYILLGLIVFGIVSIIGEQRHADDV